MIGWSISLIPLIGILILLVGSYLLDTWSISWKTPTKLFIYMLPLTLLWATNHFLVKIVSFNDNIVNMFFYQYCTITILGIMIFFTVKHYREGFMYRLKHQWKKFLWISVLAESISQISFFAWALAVSLAALATYVSAVSSIQYILLFLLFFMFPLHERNRITIVEVFSMLMIVVGVFLIELFK